VTSLRHRIAERQTIVRAVAALSATDGDQERGFAELRALAMDWRITMEEAATRVLSFERRGVAYERASGR
jgi:AmiR/NasT family two-component response regulator